MPRPPSHCVRLRQNRIARPWLSMSSHVARAGGRDAGHRLEERVDRRGDVAALDHVRHRGEHGGGEPHQRHREEAVVRAQRPRPGGETAQAEADREPACERDQERRERVAVVQGERGAGRAASG